MDVSSDTDEPTPKRVLDNDYTIRSCEPDPKEKHDPGATDIGLAVGFDPSASPIARP